MYKSRELYRDLGAAGDLLYYSFSGSTPYPSKDPDIMEYFEPEGLVRKYYWGQGKRNRLISFPLNILGVETFDSTKNERPTFNSCKHTKNFTTNRAYAVSAPYYFTEKARFYKPYSRFGTWGSTQMFPVECSSFGSWSSAARRAWWTMKPRFEGEVSLLNSIFELKDFRNIVKLMTRNLDPRKLASNMGSLWSQLRKANGKKAVPRNIKTADIYSGLRDIVSPAQTASNLRLINEFGIKPAVADFTAICTQLQTIVEHQQHTFQQKGLAPQTRHYSETETISDTIVNGTGNNYWYGAGNFTNEIFTATHEYKYIYKMRSQSEAFKRYWGLKFTPEVLWNMIPWSFLADYFGKIGNSIHAMSKDPNVGLLSSQYCESILRKTNSGYQTTGDPRALMVVEGEVSPHRGTLLSGCTSTSYHRSVRYPNKGSALPKLSLPSGRQGWNMAALAACFIK